MCTTTDISPCIGLFLDVSDYFYISLFFSFLALFLPRSSKWHIHYPPSILSSEWSGETLDCLRVTGSRSASEPLVWVGVWTPVSSFQVQLFNHCSTLIQQWRRHKIINPFFLFQLLSKRIGAHDVHTQCISPEPALSISRPRAEMVFSPDKLH